VWVSLTRSKGGGENLSRAYGQGEEHDEEGKGSQRKKRKHMHLNVVETKHL
jgi:hypothetical protein